MSTTRRRRQPEEIIWNRAQLHIHSKTLRYEMEMLVGIPARFQQLDRSDTLAVNMHVESYAIHCRAMLDFLHRGNDPKDTLWNNDVVAKDFDNGWPQPFSTLSPVLADAKYRADKHVMHILGERADLNQRGSKLESVWDLSTPTSEICNATLLLLGRAIDNFDPIAAQAMKATIERWQNPSKLRIDPLPGTQVPSYVAPTELFKNVTTDVRTSTPGTENPLAAKTESLDRNK